MNWKMASTFKDFPPSDIFIHPHKTLHIRGLEDAFTCGLWFWIETNDDRYSRWEFSCYHYLRIIEMNGGPCWPSWKGFVIHSSFCNVKPLWPSNVDIMGAWGCACVYNCVFIKDGDVIECGKFVLHSKGHWSGILPRLFWMLFGGQLESGFIGYLIIIQKQKKDINSKDMLYLP